MPELPTILNTSRVVLHWAGVPNGSNPINVMHFRQNTGDPADLYDILNSHVTSTMWAQTSNAVSINQVDTTDLNGIAATVEHGTGSPAKWTGSGGSEDVIPQVAAILKLMTARRGRSYRGRAYLPAVEEEQAVAGRYLEGTRAAQEAAWHTFVTALAGDDTELVVASYKHETAELVTSLLVEPLLGTQRRRQPRP